MSHDIKIELLKSGLALGISVLTIMLGWLVGQRLTVHWNIRQKEREFDLATAQEFHKLYGEFFAIWKLWNASLTPSQGCTVARSDLLVRACAAEGAVESLFVRLAASKELTEDNIAALGRFRQGYQRIRETIRDNKKLEWNSPNTPEYLAFKRLATLVAQLIVVEKELDIAMAARRAESLVKITAHKWKDIWASK